MRWPKPRFTVRRLMVAVAIVAGTLGYWRAKGRWSEYRFMAEYHALLAETYQFAAENPKGSWIVPVHPEIEELAPEPPPVQHGSRQEWEPVGYRTLAEYNAKMKTYWESKW
jgi:hypothetical protein